MDFGMVGLGRMGGNMVRRLVRGDHRAVVYDARPEAAAELVSAGAEAAASLGELVQRLSAPRVIWVMVPAGAPTQAVLDSLAGLLAKGDVVVDGGNSHYKDSARRARVLAERGLEWIDAGTSGGIWGAERGYCLMVGGSAGAFARVQPLLQTLAPPDGYLHCGPAGAGHFVKMVHNAIEYGMMQAYAEGFELLHRAASATVPEEVRYPLDPAAIAEVWRHGSVVSSWLLDLTARALAQSPALEEFSGSVADSGEGRWALAAALEEEVAMPALSAAIFTRFRSRRADTFAEKLLSAMRAQFGGHGEADRS